MAQWKWIQIWIEKKWSTSTTPTRTGKHFNSANVFSVDGEKKSDIHLSVAGPLPSSNANSTNPLFKLNDM